MKRFFFQKHRTFPKKPRPCVPPPDSARPRGAGGEAQATSGGAGRLGPSPSPQPHELGVRRTSCFFHAYGIEHAALNLFRMVSSWLWGNHGVQFRDRRPSRVYSHKAMITALKIVSLSLCGRRRPASIQSPKPLFKSTAPVMPDVCPPGPPADPAPALGCARCGRRGLTNQEGLAGLAESKLFFLCGRPRRFALAMLLSSTMRPFLSAHRFQTAVHVMGATHYGCNP